MPDPQTIATETPAVTKPEPKVSEDGNQVKIGDRTYITDAALHSEREKNKELKASLDAITPLLPKLEQVLKAEEAGKKAQVERAGAGDDLLEDDDIDGYAITRGYYLDDGTTPDKARAKQELKILTRVNERTIDKHVKPLAERVAADKAAANRAAAQTRQFVDGRPVADKEYLEKAMGAVPEEYLADPNVSMMVEILAAGMQSLDERRTGKPARREPAFREGGGGRAGSESGGGLSDMERSAARARGLSDEEYAAKSKRVNDPNYRSAY